jgi:hypothetical protein
MMRPAPMRGAEQIPQKKKKKRPFSRLQLAREIFKGLRSEASVIITEKWEARHPINRKLSTAKYQKLQRNFLALAEMPVKERVARFQELADQMEWATSTQLKYWMAIQAARKTLEMAPTALDLGMSKILERASKCRLPVRPTIPLQEAEAWQIAQMGIPAKVKVLIGIAFLLGQRIGDVAKLRVEWIGHVDDPLDDPQEGGYMTMTFFEGKTIARLQPYVLHLPYQSIVTRALRDILPEEGPIFSLQDYKEGRAALKSVNPNLTLLSVRKGGLQRMMLSGLAVEDMLCYSRHQTRAMLERYLDYGRVSLYECRRAKKLRLLWFN